MTIKIIDLFNKVANNEKIPEYIKIKNLKYQRQWSDYCGDEPICDLYVAIDKNNFKTLKDFSLNEEIEIIEDTPKEIARLTLKGKEVGYGIMKEWLDFTPNDNEQKICSAIETTGIITNKIIDAVNYLLKKEKEETNENKM